MTQSEKPSMIIACKWKQAKQTKTDLHYNTALIIMPDVKNSRLTNQKQLLDVSYNKILQYI